MSVHTGSGTAMADPQDKPHLTLRQPVVLDNIDLVKAEAAAEEAQFGELPA